MILWSLSLQLYISSFVLQSQANMCTSMDIESSDSARLVYMACVWTIVQLELKQAFISAVFLVGVLNSDVYPLAQYISCWSKGMIALCFALLNPFPAHLRR